MPPGRPRALDQAKRREICALLVAGFEFQEAARYVGCTAQTISREIRRNPEFRREVHDALLGSRLAPEKMLRNAAGRNWRAAAWLLERTDPQRYGRGAPPACTPDDLAVAGRWIVDVALREIAPQRRDAAFECLTAALSDVQAQVARRTNSKMPIQAPPTDFYDLAEMMRRSNPPPAGSGILPADHQKSAVKNPPSSDRRQARGTSKKPAADAAPSDQKSGIKPGRTCARRADEFDASPASVVATPRDSAPYRS